LTNVLFWMKRAQLAVRRALDEEMASFGLTAAQGEILGPLAHTPEGILHKELVEWLGVSSPTLTNLVDTLIDKGLVERRTSPQDGRAKRLYATEAGCTLAMQIVRSAGQRMQRLMDGFSETEREQFGDFLRRLARNAGDPLDISPDLRARIAEARRRHGLTHDGLPLDNEEC
jgi:DNA-binding MarR family transcriptional regulator